MCTNKGAKLIGKWLCKVIFATIILVVLCQTTSCLQQQNKKNASFKIIGEWLQLGNEKQVVLSFFPDGRLTTNNQLINSQMNDAAGMNKASFGYKYLDTAGLGYLDIILYKDAQHNTEYLRIKLIAKHNGNDTLMLNVYNNSSATIRPRSFKDSGALVWVRKN